MRHKILIVDDDPLILNMLEEFLRSLGHEIGKANDGQIALEMLAQDNYHLVISDINMPKMKGFELFEVIAERFPKVKRALITAYNVEDYLEMVLKHNVGNIISKTAPFSFADVEMVVHNLLTEKIFGIERHLLAGTAIETEKIYRPREIDSVISKAIMPLDLGDKEDRLRLALSEMLTNAIFYGARNEETNERESWDTDFVLDEEQAIRVSWGKDEEKVAFSVMDPFGKLTKEKVLYWLIRQTKTGDDGLPIGIFDPHGRGFFIARSYVDTLVINIKQQECTEVVILSYFNKQYKGHKPLYINEI